MPTVKLNKEVFETLVGKKLPLPLLKDRISMLGTDLDSIEGNEISVEVFPNRPDMLSEQGFARAFSSFIGVNTGLRKYSSKKSGVTCLVLNPPKEWPYVVTCIIKGIQFTDEKIREVVQIQEKLATTYLRNRKKGGVGIYPLDTIAFPLTFTGKKPDEIMFQPLEARSSMNGYQILERHPTGRKYAHICKDWKTFPVFIDAKGKILSMPPIINSHDMGKVDETTRDIFLEATGPDLSTLNKCITMIATALSDMGGEIFSMEVVYTHSTLTIPDLQATPLKINLDYINTRLGLSLSEADAKQLLERMGYNYKKGTVLVPAYRADIMHPIDIAEDIAIAYGYENFCAKIPQVSTIGKEDDFSLYCKRIGDMLVGYGILETKSYHLSNSLHQCEHMNLPPTCITLKNSLTEDYNVLRSWILPSLLEILMRNKHYEYPQQLFDIGTIFTPDSSQETGILEHIVLGIVFAHPTTDYTKARQIVDSLFLLLDIAVKVEKTIHPSFIRGRAARVMIGSMEVGILGEFHPQILTNWQLQTPVCGIQINLTRLYQKTMNGPSPNHS